MGIGISLLVNFYYQEAPNYTRTSTNCSKVMDKEQEFVSDLVSFFGRLQTFMSVVCMPQKSYNKNKMLLVVHILGLYHHGLVRA